MSSHRPLTRRADRRLRRTTDVRFRIGFVFTWLPRPLVWTAVLAATIAVLVGVSVWVLGARDVTGSKLLIIGGCAGLLWVICSLWPRSGRWIEVGPGGVRYLVRTTPGSESRWTQKRVAADAVARFDARDHQPVRSAWTPRALRPGTHLYVVPHTGDARPMARLRRPPGVTLPVYRRGLRFWDSWQLVRQADGSPLRWDEANAQEVADVLSAALRSGAERRPRRP